MAFGGGSAILGSHLWPYRIEDILEEPATNKRLPCTEVAHQKLQGQSATRGSHFCVARSLAALITIQFLISDSHLLVHSTRFGKSSCIYLQTADRTVIIFFHPQSPQEFNSSLAAATSLWSTMHSCLNTLISRGSLGRRKLSTPCERSHP